MNAEKLQKLQSQVRIGGKGTARRKKKVVHRTSTTDDKKLQSTLKKMTVNSIPGIEEVNMFKDDGTVIHFNNPKVQAALSSNTFAITGQAENKKVTDMMPGILNQMRPDNLNRLNNLAELLANTVAREQGGDANSAANGLEKLDKMEKNLDEDDDVPQLVQNFDEAAKINENVN